MSNYANKLNYVDKLQAKGRGLLFSNIGSDILKVLYKALSGHWDHGRKRIGSFSARGFFFILTLIIIALFRADCLLAVKISDMQMNATPNPVGSGARALGIGGAFIAIADDATAASWNPGALLRLKRPEISFVGSCFSGRRKFLDSHVSGDINDISDPSLHINYLSIAYPFLLWKRNMVFSLNYQHLYEFSMDTVFSWYDPLIDMEKTSQKRQKGALDALSPAFAIQVNPSLFLGIAANFWLDDMPGNYWENLNIISGEKTGGSVRTYGRLYEGYDFSGFNTTLGFLWRISHRLTIGGVAKTPFAAKITREWTYLGVEEHPGNPTLNQYITDSDREYLTLHMPISYGIGTSYHFSNTFLAAFDVYRTQWEDYLLCYPTGERLSPINNKLDYEANIEPTIQARFGAEYLLKRNSGIIPIRFGIFYDPEPAEGRVDDFYGAGAGTGFLCRRFSFDMAYQYRFGEKRHVEAILNEYIDAKITQHYLYTSMVLYF